jgi:hypothetical protein
MMSDVDIAPSSHDVCSVAQKNIAVNFTSAAKVLCFALITVEAVSSSASPQTSPRANQDARIGI